MGLDIEDLGYGFYRLSRDQSATIVRDSLVRLDDFLIYKVSSNKLVVHRLLEKFGIPVPAWTTTTTPSIPEKATALLQSKQGLVCKPAYESGGGTGVITGLRSPDDLLRAIKQTLGMCDTALIEEFVTGNSYRLLFLDGTLLDAVRREPPTIIGDGTSPIKRLIAAENKFRLQADTCVALSILMPDAEMKATLASAQLTLASVPATGEKVQLKTVVNQNSAVNNFRVYEHVHKSITELCQKAVNAMGVRLAGVDLIAESISRPAKDQKLAINEINCLPGLHHHYLVSDHSPEFCVASKILRAAMMEPLSNGR
jgi:cyanophycin synthetase